MDAGAALWVLVPLAGIHLLVRRRRELRRLQLAVDLMLVLLPGRLLIPGNQLVPPVERLALGYPEPAAASNLEQVDLPLQFAPWWAECRRLLGGGEPPWISDRIGGGVPLLANTQTGLPFPLQAPVWALGPDRATGVMVVLKLELAALGTFLFFRALRLRPLAAGLAALLYPFGLYSLSWVDRPLGWAHAALPWAWLAVWWALRRRRRAVAALAVLLGALVGWGVNSEVGAVAVIGTVLFALTVVRPRLRRLLPVGAGLLLAAGVAAVGALPGLAYIAGSAKHAAMAAGPLYPAPGVTWPARLGVLAGILAPWRSGHPALGTLTLPFAAAAVSWSVGSAAVVLLVLGGWRARGHRLALPLVTVGAIAAVFVLQLPPAAGLLARLPLIGSMTWARFGFLLVWALAGWAALALHAAPDRLRPAAVVAASVAVEALVLAARMSGPAAVPPAALWREGLLVPVILGVAVLLAGRRRWRAAAVTVAGFELVVLGWAVLPHSRPVDRGDPPPLVARLQSLAAGQGGRMLGLAGAFPANLPALYGLEDLRSNDPLRPVALARLHAALGAGGMDLAGPVTTPWAGLAGAWGVRWLVTPPSGLEGSAAAGWREVYRGPRGRLYEDGRALEPARLAGTVVDPPGEAATGGWESVDFATTAVARGVSGVAGEGSLRVEERLPWRWRARVDARGTVLAVLHVPRAPGWRVWLDGRPAPIVTVDLAAMAVVVPEGGHEVRWSYAPPGIVPGAALSLLALAACAVVAARRERRAG